MKTKYFNEFEFKNAVNYVDKDLLMAKIKFEEYIKKYPNDYSSYPYYISCLIALGLFGEAEKLLNYLENLKYVNDSFKYQSEKVKLLNNNIIFNYFKLLSYQHKYSELYKLCINNFSFIVDWKLTGLLFYCRKKLNMIDGCVREGNTYLYRQIINYKEEDFLDHIKKHLADFNKDLDNPNSSIFSADFPLSKIIESVKECIPSDKRVFTGFYENTYFFRYDGCGRENNKLTDYFKVICFHDTKNFITMFPCSECKQLPYIDLNYLNKQNNGESAKVKKLSQIDKFNQRYKLN